MQQGYSRGNVSGWGCAQAARESLVSGSPHRAAAAAASAARNRGRSRGGSRKKLSFPV